MPSPKPRGVLFLLALQEHLFAARAVFPPSRTLLCVCFDSDSAQDLTPTTCTDYSKLGTATSGRQVGATSIVKATQINASPLGALLDEQIF